MLQRFFVHSTVELINKDLKISENVVLSGFDLKTYMTAVVSSGSDGGVVQIAGGAYTFASGNGGEIQITSRFFVCVFLLQICSV